MTVPIGFIVQPQPVVQAVHADIRFFEMWRRSAVCVVPCLIIRSAKRAGRERSMDRVAHQHTALTRRHGPELANGTRLVRPFASPASGLARDIAGTHGQENDKDAGPQNFAGAAKILTNTLLPHEFLSHRKTFSLIHIEQV